LDVVDMGRLYEFGPFRLDDTDRSLSRDGERIRLTPKAFDVLRTLVDRQGRLVAKSELLQAVWGEVHVEEAVLTRAVSDLRKALGQTETEIWIETVPKFGYRFAADSIVSENGVSESHVSKNQVSKSGIAEIREPESREPESEEPESEEAPVRKARPRRLWILLLAATCGVMILAMSLRPGKTPAPIRTLAILPFQTVGGDPSAKQLGVGMADALITRLSRLEGLVVRPLSTVRPFEQGPADPVLVGRQLQAEAVLEGAIQFSPDSVRANVRLIRSANGQALWTESFESRPDRLFAIEDTLAEQVSLRFAFQQNQIPAPEPNAQAHLLYVEGRYEWGKRTLEGFVKGEDLFRQAIERDPSYARAYAGLADCYLFVGAYGHRPQLETLPKAKAMVRRALELNPQLAEAHTTLALITQNLDWDWPKVEQEYREAIRLAPGYSTAHHWYAEYLSIRGRFDEARKEFAQAREIDPISPIIQADEAQLYLFERKYSESLERLQQVVRSNPSFTLARERTAFLYMLQERTEDAWREAMSLPECADPAGECRLTWTAWLPRRDPSASRAALERLEAEASAGRIPLYKVTFGYIRHGQVDRALDWLERMSKTHAVWLITAKVNPIFDPLRSQPRARAVLEKMGIG
jgi:DNA-binding winged helix-turn-helix (wHTH) protein/TolB-like protein/Tfp pilus assembly protein PilF